MSDTVVTTAPFGTCERSTSAGHEEQPALSIKQKKLVEETWKFVQIDLQGAGILLFTKIFEIAPGAVALFPKFRDIPSDMLKDNEDFRAHALNVTETVDLAVSSLDDLPSLYDVLKDLGCVHWVHGIQDPHFDIVGQALIKTLEEGLGEKFTFEVREAWTAFYTMVADKMKEGLHEATQADA